jgi:predicted flavoprotein YhiN
MNKRQLIVIGGGASGLMAAGRAAEAGAEVLLLEKTPRPGNKIRLSGQGRCNLSHSGSVADFIPRNNDGRFLYHAFSRFFRDDLTALLARYGLKTITEADGRIFPTSEDARDVAVALERYAADSGAAIQTDTEVQKIIVEGGRASGVLTADGPLYADAVILAAGGASYPATGSSGDGCRLAQATGHAIVPLRPALVPLRVTEKEMVKEMQGISLSQVRLTAFRCPSPDVTPAMMPPRDLGRGLPGRKADPRVIESRSGEALYTHFGLSGPATLLMSLAVVDALARGPVSIAIDLLPGYDAAALRQALQQALDRYGKRAIHNILEILVPPRMAGVLVSLAGIPPASRGHEIDASARERLLSLLKCLRFNIAGPLSMAAATVTAGGVSLKEIEPRTMASRVVPGLYLCGEVMDIDGDSGGYNLQAAFATGYIAGESAAAP